MISADMEMNTPSMTDAMNSQIAVLELTARKVRATLIFSGQFLVRRRPDGINTSRRAIAIQDGCCGGDPGRRHRGIGRLVAVATNRTHPRWRERLAVVARPTADQPSRSSRSLRVV